MNGNDRLLQAASWLAGALLLASLVVAGLAYLRDHDHQQAIEHDRSLIVTSERLLSALKDVETGERGFIITGRDNYLEPYNWGLASVPSEEARVATLVGPEADRLSGLIADRLKEADEGIATYREKGAAAGAASIDSGLGKGLMDRIRVEIAHYQHEADGRIAETRIHQRRDDLLRIGSVIGLVASCIVLGIATLLRRREQQASQRLSRASWRTRPSASASSIPRSASVTSTTPSPR